MGMQTKHNKNKVEEKKRDAKRWHCLWATSNFSAAIGSVFLIFFCRRCLTHILITKRGCILNEWNCLLMGIH